MIGGLPGVEFVADEHEAGVTEIAVRAGDGHVGGPRARFEVAGVRFVLTESEELVR